MRLWSLLAALQLFQSDTLGHSPTPAGMPGLRHKLRHKTAWKGLRFMPPTPGAPGGRFHSTRRVFAHPVWSRRDAARATKTYSDAGSEKHEKQPTQSGCADNFKALYRILSTWRLILVCACC